MKFILSILLLLAFNSSFAKFKTNYAPAEEFFNNPSLESFEKLGDLKYSLSVQADLLLYSKASSLNAEEIQKIYAKYPSDPIATVCINSLAAESAYEKGLFQLVPNLLEKTTSNGPQYFACKIINETFFSDFKNDFYPVDKLKNLKSFLATDSVLKTDCGELGSLGYERGQSIESILREHDPALYYEIVAERSKQNYKSIQPKTDFSSYSYCNETQLKGYIKKVFSDLKDMPIGRTLAFGNKSDKCSFTGGVTKLSNGNEMFVVGTPGEGIKVFKTISPEDTFSQLKSLPQQKAAETPPAASKAAPAKKLQ